MKGVIVAGGLGTRLYPLTHVANKHLLPVYDKPMIFYPIDTLVKAGVEEIMIVVGGPHCGQFLSVLRNGHHLGVKHLEFAYQENEGGIAEALSLAEDFADSEDVAVIKKLKPSSRGELEITDVNNYYAKSGNLQWANLKGFWRDAGTFETLLEVSNFWAKKAKNN